VGRINDPTCRLPGDPKEDKEDEYRESNYGEDNRPKTGKEPQIDRGKNWRRKSRGAMNGWLTNELQISDADRPEFEEMRASLSQKYAPNTPLRQMQLEVILSCAWRLKLELRKESRIAENSNTEHKGEAAGRDTILMERWYATDYRSLQDGLRFLRDLRACVIEHGHHRLEQDEPVKESIIRRFGKTFYDSLVVWQGMNPRAIRLAEHIEYMLTTFNMKPPIKFLGECAEDWVQTSETPGLKSPPTDLPPGGPEDIKFPKVVPDPKLQEQMVVKLIDVQIEHLETLVRIRRPDSGEKSHALSESSPRSLADASRDLQQAIELFLKLEKKGF
jgi:hypothetical protein